MGIPVVVVPSGGIPVTEATNGFGAPVTVATNGFGMAVTIVSSGGLPVVGSSLPPADFTVIISKTADGSVGQTYTATPSGADSYTYQWYWVGGADISGATNQTYVAQSTDIDHVLACRVTKAGMAPVTASAIGWVQAAAIFLWQMTTTTGTTNNGSTNVTFTSDGSSIMGTFQGVSSSAYIMKAAVATATIPADLGSMVLFTELDAQASFQNISAININPVVGGTQYSTPSGVVSKSITPNTSRGKLVHSVRADQITTFAGLGSSTIDIRVQFGSSGGSSAPNAGKPKAYAVVRNGDGIPTYVTTWDDGRQSIKDWVAPQLQSRGLRSTLFVPVSNLGAGFMSEADALSLPAMGMELGIDGMPDDSVMTTQPDMATVLAGIDTSWAWLTSRGAASEAMYNFCYPNGSTRVAGTIITVAAVTANGTSTLTWSTGETATAGQEVSGFGVPYDTIVDAGGTNTCTLKNRTSGNPVTVAAQVKQASFTTTSNAFYSGKLQDALETKGMRLGRGTNNGNFHSRFGLFDQGLVLPGNSMSSTGGNGTAALMNAVVDACKTNKVTAIAYGHNAVDTIVSGLDTLKTELSAHFDYIAGEVQAQRLQVLSMSQLWARDGGSSMPGLSF